MSKLRNVIVNGEKDFAEGRGTVLELAEVKSMTPQSLYPMQVLTKAKHLILTCESFRSAFRVELKKLGNQHHKTFFVDDVLMSRADLRNRLVHYSLITFPDIKWPGMSKGLIMQMECDLSGSVYD